MTSSLKATRPNRLTENETLTSFEDWRNQIEFFLSQDRDLANFLNPDVTWVQTALKIQHRGLENGAKLLHLNRFLGIIASLAPPLLHGDIVNDTTSLVSIYTIIRSYYQLAPSESTFIKFNEIKRELNGTDLERPQHLYLRLRQFIRDNLLTKNSNLRHDDHLPTEDEILSPTTERLIVLRWLELLHPSLPKHISNVFSHELQNQTLKDIQPLIVSQIDSLLNDIAQKEENVSLISDCVEDVNIQRINNRSISRNRFSHFQNSHNQKYSAGRFRPSSKIKKCNICKAANEPFIGHDANECPYIDPNKKRDFNKVYQLECEENDEYDNHKFASKTVLPDTHNVNTNDSTMATSSRVQVCQSPTIDLYYKNSKLKVTLDSGATASLITESVCKSAGIPILPANQRAIQADGQSYLPVVGEINVDLNFEAIPPLHLTALVVPKLGSEVLAGMPFLMSNQIIINTPKSIITIHNKYDVNFTPLGHGKNSIIRSPINRVLFPGDTIHLPIPDEFIECKEFSVEPRTEFKESWPEPSIIKNEQPTFSVSNTTDLPITVKRNQVLAQIRSLYSDDELNAIKINHTPLHSTQTTASNYLDINVDPQNHLHPQQKKQFRDINKKYKGVFKENFQVYNGKSGNIKFVVNFEPTLPPPTKGRLPTYNSNNLRLLQEKFDELESLGVLARPEDLGISVVHTSPSFLVKKPKGGHRLVTSFVELNKFIKPLPTKLTSTDETLRITAQWKYIIVSDLKSAFFQIEVKEESIKWLGTVSPYKGIRVYTRAAMGLRNSSEYLDEILTRVLGDLISRQIVVKIADDLIIGANTVDELLSNYIEVLQHLQENNLSLAAGKTLICPRSLNLLGWVWKEGTLEIDPHKINPLKTCSKPSTVKQLRSFIGSYKALSKCIPNFSCFISPLEDVVAGKESNSKIEWTDKLLKHFTNSQNALDTAKIITLPTPKDQLIITTDASHQAIGATMFVLRGKTKLISGFFSAKLSKTQLKWTPCEIEALAIRCALRHFSPYIRESKFETKVFTDSKPCVQAVNKLKRGEFSLSSRLSTFLMTFNEMKVSLYHISGETNLISDFVSRNPIDCENENCQVCKFLFAESEITVQSSNTEDIVSGKFKMPFTNTVSWKNAQKGDNDLRRVYSHLSVGTRPGKKERNLKNVRRYLQHLTIAESGLLIYRKSNPFYPTFDTIAVPQSLLCGLINALHIKLNHPTKTQLKKVWHRYFFALDADKVIDECTEFCHLCNSLKPIPKELFEQSTSEIPQTLGEYFFADILKRAGQCILVVREVLSSFTVATIVNNERAETLREGLIVLTNPIRMSTPITVRVDEAPAFQSLSKCRILNELGISVTIGRTKNPNKNAVVDKAINELEKEIKRIVFEEKPINLSTLSIAVRSLNNKIRFNGLSSREILYQRDQFTGKQLDFQDKTLSLKRKDLREKGHYPSALNKSKGGEPASKYFCNIGDLVHIKSEGDKHNIRNFYLVTDINKEFIAIQKFVGNQLRSKRYLVKSDEIFPAAKIMFRKESQLLSEDSNFEEQFEPEVQPLRRSTRNRKPPSWLNNDTYDLS